MHRYEVENCLNKEYGIQQLKNIYYILTINKHNMFYRLVKIELLYSYFIVDIQNDTSTYNYKDTSKDDILILIHLINITTSKYNDYETAKTKITNFTVRKNRIHHYV